ncbi:MAG: hypothetical protein ABIO70_08270 [Pseudomonadota bacterium]
MSQTINVMLALQTPDGLAFGYVREASRTSMAFTVNANMATGTAMAWRMELKGYSETIMGRLTITRVYPPAGAGEWPRYEATVEDIPEEDLALLQVWMEDQEKGGSSRRMERDPGRFVRDMFSEGMRSASAAQTKLVIDRMNERRMKREQMFKKKKTGIGGDFGLSHETASASSSVSSQAARARMSAALGEFSRRTVSAEPRAQVDAEPAEPTADGPLQRPPSLDAPPEALPWAGARREESAVAHFADDLVAASLEAVGRPGEAPAPTPGAAEALAPLDDEPLIEDEEDEESVPPPAPEEEPAAPALTLDLQARPPQVRMRYTAASYGAEYQRHLRNSGLFLAGVALGARGRQVEVELTLPSGGQVRCAAQVVAAMPQGTGLMLALTRSDRERLAAEAG